MKKFVFRAVFPLILVLHMGARFVLEPSFLGDEPEGVLEFVISQDADVLTPENRVHQIEPALQLNNGNSIDVESGVFDTDFLAVRKDR